MLLPIETVIRALRRDYAQLLPLLADAGTQASGAVAVANALDLLAHRTEQGLDGLTRQAAAMRDAVTGAIATLDSDADTSALSDLAGELAQFAPVSLESGEADLRAAKARFERTIVELVAQHPQLFAHAAASQSLVAWESAAMLDELPAPEEAEAESTAITRETLETYLRDRFAEPQLSVTDFRPLPGGFGKETILFAVSGHALDGEFVMRRDPGDNQSLTNDCHEIAREYPVIRAAFERGFPAPDALWLDTDHALLPGGHFIVMRKSSGEMGGNFFGATAQIDPGLGDALADITARLHTLEPLSELGDLASFIKPDLWQLSRGDAARQYIAGWRDYYLSESHMPSPALMAIYGWLLENVPDRQGPSALIHGDIGFHNFLFEAGKLSAVLDWEFAHIGDPAEELGYIAVTSGQMLDWPRFMARYQASGGDAVDAATLHFFKIWAYTRNASASNILWSRFSDGLIADLKPSILPYHHYPHFIRGAAKLIEEGPDA